MLNASVNVLLFLVLCWEVFSSVGAIGAQGSWLRLHLSVGTLSGMGLRSTGSAEVVADDRNSKARPAWFGSTASDGALDSLRAVLVR